jgi:hypothetical protein
MRDLLFRTVLLTLVGFLSLVLIGTPESNAMGDQLTASSSGEAVATGDTTCYIPSHCLVIAPTCTYGFFDAISKTKAGPSQVGFRSTGKFCGVKLKIIIPVPCGRGIPDTYCP